MQPTCTRAGDACARSHAGACTSSPLNSTRRWLVVAGASQSDPLVLGATLPLAKMSTGAEDDAIMAKVRGSLAVRASVRLRRRALCWGGVKARHA
jgi:hypothetical protein